MNEKTTMSQNPAMALPFLGEALGQAASMPTFDVASLVGEEVPPSPAFDLSFLGGPADLSAFPMPEIHKGLWTYSFLSAEAMAMASPGMAASPEMSSGIANACQPRYQQLRQRLTPRRQQAALHLSQRLSPRQRLGCQPRLQRLNWRQCLCRANATGNDDANDAEHDADDADDNANDDATNASLIVLVRNEN